LPDAGLKPQTGPELPSYWPKLSSQACGSFAILGKTLTGVFGKAPIFLFAGVGISTHVRVETGGTGMTTAPALFSDTGYVTVYTVDLPPASVFTGTPYRGKL